MYTVILLSSSAGVNLWIILLHIIDSAVKELINKIGVVSSIWRCLLFQGVHKDRFTCVCNGRCCSSKTGHRVSHCRLVGVIKVMVNVGACCHVHVESETAWFTYKF